MMSMSGAGVRAAGIIPVVVEGGASRAPQQQAAECPRNLHLEEHRRSGELLQAIGHSASTRISTGSPANAYRWSTIPASTSSTSKPRTGRATASKARHCTSRDAAILRCSSSTFRPAAQPRRCSTSTKTLYRARRRGSTQVEFADGGKRQFEWGRAASSRFRSTPSIATSTPAASNARFASTTTAPLMMKIFHDDAFIFDCDTRSRPRGREGIFLRRGRSHQLRRRARTRGRRISSPT